MVTRGVRSAWPTIISTPYRAKPNQVALDERNPSDPQMTEADRQWRERSLSLDWSHPDAADPYWVGRIIWRSIHGDARPYPGRPGEAPRAAGVADDD